MPDDLLTLRECGRRLGVHQSIVRRRLAELGITPRRAGRVKLVAAAEFEALEADLAAERECLTLHQAADRLCLDPHTVRVRLAELGVERGPKAYRLTPELFESLQRACEERGRWQRVASGV